VRKIAQEIERCRETVMERWLSREIDTSQEKESIREGDQERERKK